jgi:hypothetical protein
MNTFQKEILCLNDIEKVVIKQLDSYWQQLSPQNDIGLDGIIFLGKKGIQTGKMLYVQAKYGDSYKYSETEESIVLRFPSKKITKWREYWNSKSEPVILIYQDSTEEILWGNAKEDSLFTNTTVTLPKSNKLNYKSKSPIIKLFGKKKKEDQLNDINCSNEDRPNYIKRGDLRVNSKDLYDNYKLNGSINIKNKLLKNIKFTRLGWNHINHPKRGKQRITNSLENIGLIKLILEQESHFYILKSEHEDNVRIDRLGVRANVKFNNRSSGIFQVILLNRKTFDKSGNYTSELWFLSIHEIKKD